MVSIAKILIVGMVTILFYSTGPSAVSHAGNGDLKRLQSEGFRLYRAMGNSGYTAIIDGCLLNAEDGFGVSNGFGKFRLRYCLKTQAKCSNFASRITHKITGVYDIQRTKCKARG